MNHYYHAMQQSAFATCEEVRAPPAGPDRRSPVFCPKPRRLGPLSPVDPVRPLRWHVSHQADLSEPKAGAELLDLFLTKGGDQSNVASSPPFFCGSPPTRSTNPLVRDARFGEAGPAGPGPNPVQPPSPRKGCVRAKFGLAPAAVRVEGFDCGGRRSRGITAVAG
ncbi:hypothetical protein ACMD2_12569, partial [Ananas comosus]